MFNREFQRRSSREALGRVGAVLVPDSGFYRPAVRPIPGAVEVKSVVSNKVRRRAEKLQLELFPENVVQDIAIVRDPTQPLADLFPEAYQ